jgi:threonine aldolase
LIDIAALPVETGGHFAARTLIHDPVPKGSKIMTSKQIIAAVGMALIAVPASATTNTVAAKSGKSAAADQKKYCVAYDGVVGSRVTKQECKTKAEWAKDRVDIDKLLKGE